MLLSTVGSLLISYGLVFLATAWSSSWTLEYILSDPSWHFFVTRMIVPIAMLMVLAAGARLITSAGLLSIITVLLGAISAIKKETMGVPLQLSDLRLASQGLHLWTYMTWDTLIIAAALPVVLLLYFRNFRLRSWSPMLFLGAACVLISYRSDWVVALIDHHGMQYGLRNMFWDNVLNEHRNGLPTYIYFSSRSLEMQTFTKESMDAELAKLNVKPQPRVGSAKKLDVYVILGESWWSSPADVASPFAKLRAAGFLDGMAVSPVYGGATPNAELEVLTAISVSNFRTAVVPYQHYTRQISEDARTLPRLFSEHGYRARAFHNFTRHFWLRDQVYPKFGFESFDGIESMRTIVPTKTWPPDAPLFEKVLTRKDNDDRRFSFLATVATHGPYDKTVTCDIPNAFGYCDYRSRLVASVTALISFERELKHQGRPYVILIFGDHLPALGAHQRTIGLSEKDRYLVPFFISSSDSSAVDLRNTLNGRPLYCLGPTLMQWMQMPSTDRYFSYVAERCKGNINPALHPAGPIIYHQLFAPVESQSFAGIEGDRTLVSLKTVQNPGATSVEKR